MSDAEVRYFIGCTGSGKTYLACQQLPEFVARYGWPVLAIDPVWEKHIERLKLPVATEDPFRALVATVEQRQHVRYVPRTPEDVTKLFQALYGIKAARGTGARIIVFIDEWAGIYTNRAIPHEVEKVFLAHRHIEVCVLLTTQYPGHMNPALMQCAERAYVFCCTGARALVRIEEEYQLNPDQVRALPIPGHAIPWGR